MKGKSTKPPNPKHRNAGFPPLEYSSQIVKTIETDELVRAIFSALDEVRWCSLIEKIKALQRAATIASVYEPWASHGNSLHTGNNFHA